MTESATSVTYKEVVYVIQPATKLLSTITAIHTLSHLRGLVFERDYRANLHTYCRISYLVPQYYLHKQHSQRIRPVLNGMESFSDLSLIEQATHLV